MYDAAVFEIIKTLKPSGRGELEITDVNNCYIERGKMQYDILDGWWTDAGTFESLLRASNLVCQNAAKGKTMEEDEMAAEQRGSQDASESRYDEIIGNRRGRIYRIQFCSVHAREISGLQGIESG